MGTQKESRGPFPTGLLFSVGFIVFTLVFGWSAISTILAPKSYASFSKVEIRSKTGASRTGNDNVLANSEAEVISSELILKPVIRSLNLNQAWGKKYFNDETLKSWETMEILRSRILVRAIPGSSVVEICVYDDNPNDAAVQANAITSAYMDYVRTNSGNVDVQILQTAYPGKAPVKPNVPANLTVGVLAGVFIGAACGTAISLFVYLRGRKEARFEAEESGNNLP
jgi:capsular polysaccharide biosynthesis protein